jgi:hypothetical protein
MRFGWFGTPFRLDAKNRIERFQDHQEALDVRGLAGVNDVDVVAVNRRTAQDCRQTSHQI